MCFAGGCGIDVDLSALGASPIKTLFNEELGAVVQVPVSRLDDVLSSFGEVAELAGHVHQIGSLNSSGTLRVRIGCAGPRRIRRRSTRELVHDQLSHVPTPR